MTDIFHYNKDSNNIVTVTLDSSDPVNAMNAEFRAALNATVNKLEQESPLAGVIITSAKKVFVAGGDLNELIAVQPGQEATVVELVSAVKQSLRTLEKLPVPVVAAINGAALGGGLELCLACNYRIAVNHKAVQLGLPEVNLGLLPGGGGIVRLVNLIGLQAALPVLLDGKNLNPSAAKALGLIDAMVDDPSTLVSSARDWILANSASSTQPWDKAGFSSPGGAADSAELAALLAETEALLAKKTRGLLPAPIKIVEVAKAATTLPFEQALQLESEALAFLVTTAQAKNMINTFFFQMNRINAGSSRPQGFAPTSIQKVGILGAGMMGQGITFAAATNGISVVLKDISVEAAEKGKAYTEKLLEKQVQQGRISSEQKQQTLALIKPTAENNDLAGCELIIEAVFENVGLKHKITQATENQLAEDGIWASNTSTLPITMLAEVSTKPENFIGLHFFSPVDKMPLVEIICGKLTSKETLARAFDFTRQIKKTPIVVNDSPGFYTSRTIITYMDEGVRLLVEGVDPTLIDKLGAALGMPVGPLAIHDETSQQLTQKILDAWRDLGLESPLGDTSIVYEVVSGMMRDYQRGGRHHGGGFYEYPADARKFIWPTLIELYYKDSVHISDADIQDRLLFRPVIETLRCLDSNVLPSSADGNIGSLLGIGAPTWTGGYIQFVNTYGADKFLRRCAELEASYGERFALSDGIKARLNSGEWL